MVINDFGIIQKFYKNLIESGYNLVISNKIEKSDIDNYRIKLVIANIRLENQSTIENLKAIKSIAKELKIIIISDTESFDKRLIADKIGVNAYFDSTNEPKEILRAIKKIIKET